VKASTALLRLGAVTFLSVCLGMLTYHFLSRSGSHPVHESQLNIYSSQDLESILPLGTEPPFADRYLTVSSHVQPFTEHCLRDPISSGPSQPVGPIIDADYDLRNKSVIHFEFERVQRSDIPRIRSAFNDGSQSCENEYSFWDQGDQEYGSYTETRIGISRVGDASAEFRATAFHWGNPSGRKVGPGYGIGPSDIFAISHNWYIHATVQSGQQQIFDVALPPILHALDRRLATRFEDVPRTPTSGNSGCGTPSTRLMSGTTPNWDLWTAKLTLLHDAACRGDYVTLASAMSPIFSTDRGVYTRRNVIEAWAKSPSGKTVLNLARKAFESPGDDRGSKVIYRAGDSSAVFYRQYSQPQWSGFIESCSKIPRDMLSLCEQGHDGRLASVDWTKAVRDVNCEESGHGLGVDSVQYQDVTGDGRPDAIVAVSCIPVTSSWAQKVEVFDGSSDPANPKEIAILLDYSDGTDERGLREAVSQVFGNTIFISSLGYRPQDANAGTSLQVMDTFTWNGHGFVRGVRSVSARDW
jgi:hypothetical protein